MRTLLLICAVLLGTISSTGAQDSVLPTWFDYDNCAFCSKWGAHPDLIAHAHDDFRDISTGVVWVTNLDSGYDQLFGDVMKEEAAVSTELEQGKKLPICQYCNALGKLMEKGMHMESVHVGHAEIALYTATDTALVKEIQAFAAKALAEEQKANAAFWAKKK